jgi:hypothetical protein
MPATLTARSREMRDCRWAARRIQMYLDADPSATLLASDVQRIERHLLGCTRCRAIARDLNGLSRQLEDLGLRGAPDPVRVARIRDWAAHTLGPRSTTIRETP